MEIAESDWKVFRELRQIALDRFCKRILGEVINTASDESSGPHPTYLAVYDILRRRDGDIAEIFNDFRRSTAFFQIAKMKARSLITEQEFSQFSHQVHEAVRRILQE